MSESEKEPPENEEDEVRQESNLIEDAEIVEDNVEPEAEEAVEKIEEAVEPSTAEVIVDPSEMQETPRARSPLIPMILGGVVAGTIGFGAATYLNFGAGQNDQAIVDLSARLDGQAALIDAQNAEIARLQGMGNTATFERSIQIALDNAAQQSAAEFQALNTRLDALQTELATVQERTLDLEKRPMAEAFSDDAIAAYEAEMANLRDAIDQHRAEIEAIAAEARAKEDAARLQSVRSEGASYVTNVSIAIADGSSFVEPLDALKADGVAIPTALNVAAADGVTTLSELIADFPPAARAALAAVRSAETADDSSGGLLTFLQNQIGARSVSPREGNSADAILSRAEAAAQSGDLALAISELAELPEVGQAAMSVWILNAQERIDVVEALDGLRQSVLNK